MAPKIDSGEAARRAAEARRAEEARRRAEEARRAAEAARRAAEAAKQAAAQAAQKVFKKDEVSTGRGSALKVKALGLTGANQLAEQLKVDRPTIAAKDLIRTNGQGASSLLTEDANDGRANCLDRAVDYAKTLTPEQQKKAELVVLDDTRPGVEGTTGHVVVREDGGRVTDPTSGKKYESTEAYLKSNPQYREAGTVKATDAQRIFETKAGSPERAKALDDAKVPQSLRTMLVNDATPGYDKSKADADAQALHDAVDGLGTDEDKIWRHLEGKSKEDVDLIRQSYKEKFGGSLDDDIRGDLSGGDLDRANRALSGLQGSAASVKRAEDEFDADALPKEHVEKLKANENDPEYTARYVQRLAESGKLDATVGYAKDPKVFAGRAGYIEQGEPYDIGKSLKVANEKGRLSEGEINQRAVGGPHNDVWQKVQTDLAQTRIDRVGDARGGIEQVKTATQAFNDADEKAKKLDEELAKQLGGLDKGLTDAQRSAYAKAFQEDPKNKPVYEAREAKAKELADAISKNKAALQNAAVTSTADAGELKKALNALSDTSQAKAALEFIKDAPKATLDVLGGKAFVDGVFEKAGPKTMTQFLAEAENPADAFKQFAEFTNQLKPAFDAYGGWGQMQEGLEAMKSIETTGDFNRLKQLTEGWKTSSPLLKGIAGAGLVIGAVQAADKGREGEYLAMTKEIAGAGRGGLEILAGATNSLSEAGKLARFGVDAAKATKFATFASRLAPGLGLVAAGLSAGLRIQDIKNDPDAGKIVALMGDTIGVLGAAVELIPVAGTAVGLVISGVGAAITAVGEFISNTIQRGELEGERKKYLEQIGIAEPARSAIAEENMQYKGLVNDLGLSPEQLQEVAKQQPALFTTGLPTSYLAKILNSQGLHGEKAAAFFSKLPPNSDGLIKDLLWTIQGNADVINQPDVSKGTLDGTLYKFKHQNPEGAKVLEAAGLVFT